MTGRNYADDIMIMLNTQYATNELDLGMALHFANVGRRKAFTTTREMFPQLWTLKKTGSNPIAFADSDLLARENGVMVDPGSGNLVSARKASLKELRTIQNHTYEAPATTDPVFTRVLKTFQVYPTGGNIVVYYLKEPTDLALTDTETQVPAMLWKFAIKSGIVDALKKLAMAGAINLAQQDLQFELSQIVKNSQAADKNIRENVQSKRAYQTKV